MSRWRLREMAMAQALRQERKFEGIQEGEKKVEKQASMKIARQMLKSGMDRQSVMKFSSLK